MWKFLTLTVNEHIAQDPWFYLVSPEPTSLHRYADPDPADPQLSCGSGALDEGHGYAGGIVIWIWSESLDHSQVGYLKRNE